MHLKWSQKHHNLNQLLALLDYGKNHNRVFYLVNIENTIIQTIIFEFENMICSLSIALRIIFLVTENFEISP